jgi:hypothetical protein
MFYSPAFIFSSVYSLGFEFLAGLRLWALRQFQAFLASSPCAASATSYHFSSSASPPWHNVFSRFAPVVNSAVSVLASGSNCAVKPTRLRRAAYFLSLVCENVITESFVLLVQELVSSIAFKIAVRLKVGQHERWKRMALEFFVFALLVIPLFFIFGWLFLQAVSWLL